MNDAARYSSGFSCFGAGHDAALGHKGAMGSSAHEVDAFWSALMECKALLDDMLHLQGAKSWTHPLLHGPPRVGRDDGKIKKSCRPTGLINRMGTHL